MAKDIIFLFLLVIIMVFLWDARETLKNIEGYLENLHCLTYETWKKHASDVEIEEREKGRTEIL